MLFGVNTVLCDAFIFCFVVLQFKAFRALALHNGYYALLTLGKSLDMAYSCFIMVI